MQVWKFPLEVTDEISVDLPFGAKCLTVQAQNGVPCIWALVDPHNTPDKPTKFRIVGTGHEYDGTGQYIGTFQLMDGALIFHVFKQ